MAFTCDLKNDFSGKTTRKHSKAVSIEATLFAVA